MSTYALLALSCPWRHLLGGYGTWTPGHHAERVSG